MILYPKVSRTLLALLIPLFLFGKGGYWNQQDEISLKKDEFQEIKIFDPVREKSLFFRWTLYINRGLVVIAHYDRFPHQYVLYKKDYRQDTFKIRFGAKKSFAMIQFVDFDLEKNQAKFNIFLKGRGSEIVEKGVEIDSK